MAETIDSLLVELGLDTDKQSFNEAGEIFTSLRSKALLFGAAIGAIGGLAQGITASFASEVDQLGKFGEVYNATAQDINRVGFALELMGGKSEDAFSSIARLRELQARWQQGDFPDAAAFFGIDPRVLQSTGDLLKDYERLAQAVQGMGTDQRRNALQALGFSDAEIRLFGSGIDTMRRYFKEADKFSVVTGEMTDNAADFNDSVTRLGEAVEGVRNIIGNELAPSLKDFNNSLADFIAANAPKAVEAGKDLIKNTEKEFMFLFDFFANVRRDVDMVKAGRGADVASESTARLLSYIGLGDFVERSREREAMRGEDAGDGFRFFQSAPSAQFGDNANVTNYNISVDARGAQNPQAVENAATRAIQKALQSNARNVIRDTRTPAR